MLFLKAKRSSLEILQFFTEHEFELGIINFSNTNFITNASGMKAIIKADDDDSGTMTRGNHAYNKCE